MNLSIEKIREHLRAGGSLGDYPKAALDVLREKYSHFEDTVEDGFITDSRHVVKRVITPKPYIHLMTNLVDAPRGVFGSFCDPLGYGFSCLDSVLAGSVTSHKDPSYVPTAPRASDFRGLWIREQLKKGEAKIWHLIPQPGEDEGEGFSCEQGLGFVRMSSQNEAVLSEWDLYVPKGETGEIWKITLRNLSKKARKVSLFAAVTWGLTSHPGDYFDPRVVSVGEVYKKQNAIRALNLDKNNRHPRTGLMVASVPFSHHDLSGESFWGVRLRGKWPEAVKNGACADSMGRQPIYGMVGAMQFDLALAPSGETSVEIFVGNTSQDTVAAKKHMAHVHASLFGKKGRATRKDVTDTWQHYVGKAVMRSPDPEVDRYYNIWSKYQAYQTSRWTRALDKVGYRDVLQDLMSITNFNSEAVRPLLLEALRYQLTDGRAIRQYSRFPHTAHDERMYMDSSLWIVDTLVGYLKETGDFKYLDEKVPFYDLANHRVDETKTASVYEHAILAVKSLWDHRGQHGFSLIGHGDWNDSLDEIGKKGRGVSVWLSTGLVYGAELLKGLAVYRKDQETAAFCDEIIRTVTKAINDVAWDGHHYIHAFDDDGNPIGTKSNTEGKYHLNVNAWAVFTGIAAAGGHLSQTLKAMAEADTPLGHQLIKPSYTLASRAVGRIADIVPGQFENGSIYNHGQSFVMYAKISLRDGVGALCDLKKTMPSHTLPEISTSPLHQQTNYTVGPEHPDFGKHLYDNFTGSLAWYRKALDRMLGLVPDYNFLLIDPILPTEWTEVEVRRVWRGVTYHARIKNRGGLVTSVTVDGKALKSEGGEFRLKPISGKKEVRIEVETGSGN